MPVHGGACDIGLGEDAVHTHRVNSLAVEQVCRGVKEAFARTTITAREQAEIDRANASGAQPVVFVHGLWLLPSSWDDWRSLFEGHGFVALAPGWPDDPAT